MKKSCMITGIMLGLFIAFISPSRAYANGMPCTEATLKDAIALKEIADKELAEKVEAKRQADLKVQMLKSQGIGGLELQIATDAATRADQLVKDYMGKVANAQQFIDSVVSRGNTEQYYLDMEDKWKARAALDLAQMKVDGATELSNAAQANVTAIQNAAAQAANVPALTPEALLALQNQLAAAQAAAIAAQAAKAQASAQYNAIYNSNTWATNADNENYGRFVREYGTNLAKTYTILGEKGEPDTKITYYEPDKPNEWSIRWFE